MALQPAFEDIPEAIIHEDMSVTTPDPDIAVAAKPALTVFQTLRAWRDRYTPQWVRDHPRVAYSLAALAIYAVIAYLYFGLHVQRDWFHESVGSGADVAQNNWYLAWWPHALRTGINPFITDRMWAPYGYNLAWQTSLPGLSILSLPILLLFGSNVAYNALVLTAFPLTAWVTYYLCYHFTRQFWASLVGGYLFGFSSFMIAQGAAHIHLICLYFIPLSVYLYVLRYENKLARIPYIIFAALSILGMFLISVEEITLFLILGFMTVALFMAYDRPARPAHLKVALETIGAGVACLLILTPYLYYLVVGYVKGESHSVEQYSSDLLGFIIPTPLFWVGHDIVDHITPHFAGGNYPEMDSYIGVPLLAVVVAFAIKYRRAAYAKALLVATGIIVLLTIGPHLYIDGNQTLPTPAMLFFKLPILEKSLPVRFAVFLELLAAVIAALWLAKNTTRPFVKYGLGLLLVVMFIPNLAYPGFFSVQKAPPFFTQGMYKSYLAKNETVLILPFAFKGPSMLWQEAADYRFINAGGYGGLTPKSYSELPEFDMFVSGDRAKTPNYQYYITQFIVSHHVQAILVDEADGAKWTSNLAFLHVTPRTVGGVIMYQLPDALTNAHVPCIATPARMTSTPFVTDVAQWDQATGHLTVPATASGIVARVPEIDLDQGDYTLKVAIAYPATTATPGTITIDQRDERGRVAPMQTAPLNASGVVIAKLHVTEDGEQVYIEVHSAGIAPLELQSVNMYPIFES